ncbi:hypothetical protein RRG08_057808 [Elysia crispata]|uniref:Uncharacterized protein n=1 Tax=Elysia crispata TaxID=231223 RepID=A0AAE1B141_9GAST|nr:hypothetical protein RRG08_057808 [Elysia crispata]
MFTLNMATDDKDLERLSECGSPLTFCNPSLSSSGLSDDERDADLNHEAKNGKGISGNRDEPSPSSSDENTELMKLVTSSNGSDVPFEDPAKTVYDTLLPVLQETIRTSINASLSMHSIWTFSQLSDEHKCLSDLNQEVRQDQHMFETCISQRINELSQLIQNQTLQTDSCLIEFQRERQVFAEKLKNVEEGVRKLDTRTEEHENMLRKETTYLRNLLSTSLNTKIDKLCHGVASQADSMQSRLLELDARLTSTLEDIREGQESSKIRAQTDMRDLYSALENKIKTCSIDICKETDNSVQMAKQQDSGDIQDVRNRPYRKIQESLEILADQLDKTNDGLGNSIGERSGQRSFR